MDNPCHVTNRAPMQWSDGLFAGFTTGNSTWIEVCDDYHSVNVEVGCRCYLMLLEYERKEFKLYLHLTVEPKVIWLLLKLAVLHPKLFLLC